MGSHASRLGLNRRGVRLFAEQYGRPIVLYLKHDRWLDAEVVGKLYRDGLSLGPAVEAPIDVGDQADLGRLFITGSVRLSSNLEPGNYYLQVVIVNKAVKDKQPSVTQWVDFEIVK